MLDKFTVFSRTGVVIWSRTMAPIVGPDPVDGLIRNVLLEERSAATSFEVGPYKMSWTLANDVGLVFVAVFQKILVGKLGYLPALLSSVKREFTKQYREHGGAKSGAAPVKMHFDANFDKLFAKANAKRSGPGGPGRRVVKAAPASRSDDDSQPEEDSDGSEDEADSAADSDGQPENVAGVDAGAGAGADGDAGAGADGDADADADPDTADGGDAADGGDGNADADPASGMPDFGAGSDANKTLQLLQRRGAVRRGGPGRTKASKKKTPTTASPTPSKKPGKRLAPSSKPSKASLAALDRSKPAAGAGAGGAGGDVLPGGARLDDDDEDPFDAFSDSDEDGVEESKSSGGWFGRTRIGTLFSSLSGSRVLTEEDMEEPLEALAEQLMAKNVAKEIADNVCSSVGRSTVGKKLERFTTVASTVKEALRESIETILTPKTSINVLNMIETKKRTNPGEPYVIVFIGVNGVGKSTSLSKVTHLIKSNGFKPMLAACDTFRAGAVEQLGTHSRALEVPLFQRGYEKDPAMVAAEAIRFAKSEKHDVVLVDTAGRMQNNTPLMQALAKLVCLNQPDLVLFVGEALVGNDGIDQLSEFNRALIDYTPPGMEPRRIDGIILTKFDTIDDKVGAALSMVYKTGQPIVFVGTGQKYTNLHALNVNFVVKSLLA